MKKNTFKLLFLMLLTFYFAEAQHQIVPAPRSYEVSDGELTITQGLQLQQLSESDELKKQLNLFTSEFKKMGIDLASSASDSSGVKTLKIGINETAEDTLGTEGYHLVIEPDGILLMANSTAGTFNGLQTLKQLFPVKREVSADGEILPVKIQSCIIQDAPRFGWRGLMLDVSRHFFTVDEIKAYLDQMAEFKFNVF